MKDMLAISELFSCREPSYLLNTWLLLTTREIEPWSGQRKTINLTALFLEQDFNDTPLKKSSLKFDIKRRGLLGELLQCPYYKGFIIVSYKGYFFRPTSTGTKKPRAQVKHEQKPCALGEW